MEVNMDNMEINVTRRVTQVCTLDWDTALGHSSVEDAAEYEGDWDTIEEGEPTQVEYYLHNAVELSKYRDLMGKKEKLQKIVDALKRENLEVYTKLIEEVNED